MLCWLLGHKIPEPWVRRERRIERGRKPSRFPGRDCVWYIQEVYCERCHNWLQQWDDMTYVDSGTRLGEYVTW